MSTFRHSMVEIRDGVVRQDGIFEGSRVIVTTDSCHPGLQELQPNMQYLAYLVLPDEEIELGLLRPLRRSYQHVLCNGVTRIGPAIAETFARRPSFYEFTFCANCRRHFPLKTRDDEAVVVYHFFWCDDGEPVGE